MKKIEILSPAGDVKSLYAAFEAGADAVYFGVSEFNARKRAVNIELKDLPLIVSEAYLRSIKLYLTLNTLVTADEIPQLLELIDSVMASGIKCFIIQDYGILNILEKYYPEAEIHISTQVTTHLKGQIDFLSRTSASRINLARELSIDEVFEYTDFAHAKGIETEVFIHGSYCLSYSGQCYLSSFLEGLSGNRGLCAQLCRRLYRMDGRKGYFLNLKDNSAISAADKLLKSGADSLKIEGRIKGSEYVYTVVKAWKDLASGNCSADDKSSIDLFSKKLSSVFNRGFTSGYIDNDIEGMFSDNPSDSSWENAGTVVSYSADRKILETGFPLHLKAAGDVQRGSDNDSDFSSADIYPFPVIIKRKTGSNDLPQYVCSGNITAEKEKGRYLFEIEGKLNGKIENGNSVWLRPFLQSSGRLKRIVDNPVFRKIPAALKAECREGERFALTLEYGGKSVTAFSDNVLEKGRNRTSTKADVEKQLARFGNTPFEIAALEFPEFDESLFIPSSLINKTRRKAVSMFLGTAEEKRKDAVLGYLDSAAARKNVYAEDPAAGWKNVSAEDPAAAGRNKNTQDSETSVFAKTYQGDSALKTVFLADNAEIVSFLGENREGEIFYDAGRLDDIPDSDAVPVFPSIMSPEYADAVESIIKEGNFNRIVLNNTAHIAAAEKSGIEWIAGNSFNILNHSAADFFGRFNGFSDLIISPEAGKNEIKSLTEKTGRRIYLPFYFRAELMTTRQCLLGMRCGKTGCDEDCFKRCCGRADLTDVRGKRIDIEKRENRYTALYDKKYHFIHKAVSDFKDENIIYMIDLRIFPGILSVNNKDTEAEIEKRKKLYYELSLFIESRGVHKTSFLNSLVKNTSEGNYSRGLL